MTTPLKLYALFMYHMIMSKSSLNAYSRYSQDALALLGGLIRTARIERKLTAKEIAERAGISRGLLQRIEKGDPKCAIGSVFEVAAILGVPLFNTDDKTLRIHRGYVEEKLALLPKSIRKPSHTVEDDF